MSLKSKNMSLLSVFLAANVALLLIVLGRSEQAEAVAGLDLSAKAGVSAVLMVIAFVLSDAIGDKTKARLVFWRWKHPLPGCFAFSRYALEDERVDLESLQQKHGPFPADPMQQNKLWYNALFKPHRDKPNLAQSHGRYLLLRDMAAISAVLLIALSGPALLLGTTPPLGLGYVAALVMQYLLASLAANNAGVRLVKNTLAEACT